MVGVILEIVLPIKLWQLTTLYPPWKEACEKEMVIEKWRGGNGAAFLKALSFGFMPSFCNVHFFPFIHLGSPAGEGLGNINL